MEFADGITAGAGLNRLASRYRSGAELLIANVAVFVVDRQVYENLSTPSPDAFGDLRDEGAAGPVAFGLKPANLVAYLEV